MQIRLNPQNRFNLHAPLNVAWSPQYVRLHLLNRDKGLPFALREQGKNVPFQLEADMGKEGVLLWVKLGFAKGEVKTLEVVNLDSGVAGEGSGRLPESLPVTARMDIGSREDARLILGDAAPFLSFGPQTMHSEIQCDVPLEDVSLVRSAEGPLFSEYRLLYTYAENRRYALTFRCFTSDPWVEVTEEFSLGLNARLVWSMNPERQCTHIVSRDSFEGESQPTVEELGSEKPRDILCRLQMPVLTEYYIPNNRGWFAFFDKRDPGKDMWGLLGLYGSKWEEPVANMPVLYDRDRTVVWESSLCSGRRHWLLVRHPLQTAYTAGERFVFHRLHAEFNALRLDEHLDLGSEQAFFPKIGAGACLFPEDDFHALARERVQNYPCLQAILDQPDDWMSANGDLHQLSFRYAVDPSPETASALYRKLEERFERWVRQFQGYRTGANDYMKNVIGFSRYLRGILIAAEQLRRDGVLTDDQERKLTAWCVFAARRMLDEGRWPTSRTWKHPDHPESSRDFYTYGGEHKPDKLIWTNSLPNFQSDPMCALAHLASLFPDHPEAPRWLRLGLEEIDRQLDAYCGKSGAWEESINYALYTLSYFVITFKSVRTSWGINYFEDERVRRFVGWLCRFAGPVDKRFGVHTMPGVGNAVLPQLGAEFLLCYAGQLGPEDPLRAACLRIWEKGRSYVSPVEHYPVVMAALAPLGDLSFPADPGELSSECMDEVGVALRDRQGQDKESYLFQKIGFAKDHFEQDETAFNWYAKGTPLCMEYGTYTGEAGVGAAHNLVEIPDEDSLRRGYLADHLFLPALDYTRCEVPVTLKLLWGKVRSFAEIDNQDKVVAGDRRQTPYFYIGDPNPVGPKVWKVRQLLFVKPDYTVLFDRVYGRVPHRYNLHVTGEPIVRDGAVFTSSGCFDLDLLGCVQHPATFRTETGELVPKVHKDHGGEGAGERHAQNYVRIYNQTDGIYRTLLFAREKGRRVSVTGVGLHGFRVSTDDYEDTVFIHNDFIEDEAGEIRFAGRVGWFRVYATGRVHAVMVDGERFEFDGRCISGKGPWEYERDGEFERVTPYGSPPRELAVQKR